MSSQALRSVYRARPELGPVGSAAALRGFLRPFSTTPSRLDETPSDAGASNNNNKPTARQRTRAAASEINSLVKNRPSSGGNAQNAQKPAGAASTTPQQPRVIDVKSLPRGGMLRGRGGLRARGTGTGPGAASGNRFAAGANNNKGKTSALNAGRGGRAAGGRGGTGGNRFGGGGGGAGKGRFAKKKTTEGEAGSKAAAAAGPRGKRQDPFERMDPQEQQFDDAMRFGTKTAYSPALTKDALAAFVPAMPSTPESRLATVLENLNILGGKADPVGVPQNLQAKNYADEVEARGARFFADVKARDAAEAYLREKRTQQLLAEGKTVSEEELKKPIVQGAEEAVRTAILEQAVGGKHETPRFATDPVGIARAWHLRAGTYTQRDVEGFEKKLTALLGGGHAKGGKSGKAQAKV